MTRTIKILPPSLDLSDPYLGAKQSRTNYGAATSSYLSPRIYGAFFTKSAKVGDSRRCRLDTTARMYTAYFKEETRSLGITEEAQRCVRTPKNAFAPPPPRRRRLKNVRPSSSEGFVADPSLKLRTTRWHHLDGIIRWRRRRRRRTPPKGEEEARKKSHYIGPCVTFFRGPRLCSGT